MHASRRALLSFALCLIACLAVQSALPYVHATSQSIAFAQPRAQIYLPLISSRPPVVVTGPLQAAVDAANPGDTLLLGRGVVAGDLTIRRAGTPSAPITLMGAGIGQTIIQGAVRVNDAAAYWRIQDLDVNAAGEKDGLRIEAPAHHISLARMHLYGGRGYGVRIGSDTAHVLIEDSEIDHFDAGESDAHGVGIMTASDVVIRRCNITITPAMRFRATRPTTLATGGSPAIS